MAISDDTLLALGTELLGWNTDSPDGLAEVLADLELLHQLHERTRLETTAMTATEFSGKRAAGGAHALSKEALDHVP